MAEHWKAAYVLSVSRLSCLAVLFSACTSPVDRAAEAFELGDYRLAQQILEEAVASDPDNLPTRYLLADVHDSISAIESALDNARVLANLEPRPRNTFRLVRLSAQAGDFPTARALVQDWPSDSVSAFIRRTAIEQGDSTLAYLPYFQKDLGVGDYLTGRVLVAIQEKMGDDDYFAGEDIAGDIADLAEVAPALLPIVRQPAEDYLAALPEPRGLSRGLYVMNVTRHDRAVGRLFVAIGEYDRALSTYRGLEMLAASLYETGEYDGFQLMNAMGERVDLYLRSEQREEARARCRELQSQFPDAYVGDRPFTCIRLNVQQ